jgi:CRISPR/Cas system CSM-associated protein Csm3 (group 7 of RAMP superfamily)
MNKLCLLTFHWKGTSPLHSGYSSDFAKFAKGVGSEKISVNLETRDADHNLVDSFLASSVKGIFRTASAWLVEKIARDALDQTQFVTCDYWGEDAPQDKRMGCPVCQVYGGSGCRVVDGLYRERAKATFTFGTDNALHPQTRVRGYNFAHEQISGKLDKKLEVESLQVENSVFLHIRLNPADGLPVALTCLATDLISSGFFRFGRFTSRGYGVVRLVPHKHFYGSLADLLAADDDPCEPSGVGSGYELARNLLGQGPLEVVKEAVRKYVESEG